MDVRSLRIIEPNETLYEAYMQFCQNFHYDNWQYINGIGPMLRSTEDETLTCKEDFLDGIKRCLDFRSEDNLPKGWVPCSTYWLIDNSENIHGTACLRHRLSDSLITEGGHIGFAIKPESRNHGAATQLLHTLKLIAKNKNIDAILLTCNKDNAAARRVIEKSSGVKAEEYVSNITGNLIEKFWINL
ncbi:Acetyltransferase (GNAT) family protein [Poriferisphaera corsica]|uniref:Acetyltransferase (GNAT) family protein n=1 Tax=Poriferisphaera corsica TaxID=2528020 RepID=A0A517YWY2_9BACT|nr:GNAT family N-acetyltransferase [Poriferisphaera corsica]QDU34743.1 Acetyltransferase (GNAT) family protein [Poriferisphaera corsica]